MMASREMTDQERAAFMKNRRRRNIAIALVLVALVGIFYAITVVHMGPQLLVRDL
jgi:hypothetical protein